MNLSKKVDFLVIWLIVLSSVYLLSFVYTLDTDKPVGTQSPSIIDDEIRLTKDAYQERLNVDHIFDLTGSQVSAADSGKHRQVTFQTPLSADPTSVDADELILYTKDVSDKAELHCKDEDENVLVLSSAGYIPGDSIKADSIDEGEIQLANNSYLVASNAAGDGEIDLIKADANDVMVIPDGSETATNAAPTCTKGIANKKYIDDQLPDDDAFGTWTNLDSESNALAKGEVYQVGSDGFLLVRDTYNGGTSDTMEVFTDNSNPPTTLVAESHDTDGGTKQTLTVPIKKNHYWKITWNHTVSVYWLPIGSGECQKQ